MSSARASTVQIVSQITTAEAAELAQLLPATRRVQVVHVENEGVFELIAGYAPYVQAYLLDSGRPNLAIPVLGGASHLDWQISAEFVRRRPHFLWFPCWRPIAGKRARGDSASQAFWSGPVLRSPHRRTTGSPGEANSLHSSGRARRPSLDGQGSALEMALRLTFPSGENASGVMFSVSGHAGKRGVMRWPSRWEIYDLEHHGFERSQLLHQGADFGPIQGNSRPRTPIQAPYAASQSGWPRSQPSIMRRRTASVPGLGTSCLMRACSCASAAAATDGATDLAGRRNAS